MRNTKRKSKKRTTRKLTEKQAAFVKEYPKDGNATEAAKRAGYEGSRKTLGSVGSKLVHTPEVYGAIREELERTLEEVGLTAEKVVRALDQVLEQSKSSRDRANIIRVADIYFKLRGIYAPEKQQVEHYHEHIHITPEALCSQITL